MKANVYAKLEKLFKELETKNFFELTAGKQREVDIHTKQGGLMPIEYWSFTPHPEVIPSLNGQLQRHLVMIDTVSSDIYFPVLDFLTAQKANVASYYSGGWADFVCDVRFTEQQFDNWKARLNAVLLKAKANQFGGPSAMVTTFEVKTSHATCGALISDLARPKASILNRIKSEPHRFELAYRNYRSEDTLRAFGNDTQSVKRYLQELKEGGAILCYRLITDISRHYPRDFVALRMNTRAVTTLLTKLRDDKLRLPVEEFFEVANVESVDPSEKSITHMFINKYERPGDRIDWKLEMYRAGVTDINLYNYPLEGTVNETENFISDYPEFLERAARYSAIQSFAIGNASYTEDTESGVEVGIPLEGLGYNGVTLGIPNSGKTNADVVLAEKLLSSMQSIVFLDGTKGVWPKIEASRSLHAVAHRSKLGEGADLTDEIQRAILSPGLWVLEFEKDRLAQVLATVVSRISASADASKGGEGREIRHVLFVEEAADAWVGGDEIDRPLAATLARFLQESMRKGWAVWFSTQQPIRLGPSSDSSRELLTHLKNRIVLGTDNNQAKEMLLEVMRDEGHYKEDVDYAESQLDIRVKGRAMLRAVATNAEVLPPIFVKIPLVGRS